MKNILIIFGSCLVLFLTINICLKPSNANAQSFIGAWERNHISKDGVKLKSVVIFSKSHQVLTTYETLTGEFIYSNGGTWKFNNNIMTEKVEFDTNDSTRVGSIISFDVKISDSTMSVVGSNMKFKRIDNGRPGKLNGAWLMSARFKEGTKQLRDTTNPRKTMKILSGTRFQWIAYNTESKKFMATGGGSYSTLNGDYVENIEFFSRDNSKVGLNLEFDYEILIKTDDKKLVSQKNWYHKGFSSKGNPINEIWTQR